MDDVRKWLSRLKLDYLSKAFEKNQVDFDTLRLLSDSDLREMQIPLGPRKKLLIEIKRLIDDSGKVLAPISGERRQLTILFCDLVDSTEYAVRMDPEDFSTLTRDYLNQCNIAVRNHNGFAANYIGDAFQALFGYPIAEEDDAERALQLAFELLRLVPGIEVPEGPPLRVRIGIASGVVVVGDYLAAPAGVSTVAMGSIPNLAQRLQTIAEPQTILADQRTYDSTAGAFEFTDLGPQTLKGFSNLVRVWRAEKPHILENRFAKRTQLTELVDRRPELTQILKLWREVVTENHGQAALICGEPGIGKSRLIFEAQRRMPRCTYLTLQCSTAYSNSALFPFLTLMKRYAGMHADDPADISLERLEAVLAFSDIPVSESLPIFARLLSISQTRYPSPNLTSARQRMISVRVVIDWLHHISRINRVLLSIEDEQWIDPSSSDVLEALIEEVASFPMLIVITTREKRLRRPLKRSELRKITLERLSDDDAHSLVGNVGKSLPQGVRSSVLAKAEGVPLYVEELARAALETSTSHPNHRSNSGVPGSLQSSLLSRLDKLGPGKMIAQVAAVIGREFALKLLAHLCGLSSSSVHSTLGNLVLSGLVAPQITANQQSYMFTHVLLQEAARDTLLRERCRELHVQVAQAIEEIEPKLASEHPELLAQHYAEGGMLERAADCWLAAGLNVSKTWAKVEAANMFANGVKCLHKLPASVERKQKELRLWLEIGDVHYATFGYVTKDGSEAYRNAMRLSEELEDTVSPVRALDGLFGTAFNSAHFADAEWASDQLLDIGTKHENLKALVLGLQFKGMSLFSQGNLAEARDHLERSLAHQEHASKIGSDFPSMPMLYLSWTLQLLGDHERAIEFYSAAEHIARQQSAYRLAACLGNGCILHALRNDVAKLRELTDELIPLAGENGFHMWLNMGLFFHGWATVRAEGNFAGLEEMRSICNNLGDQEIDKSCYLGLLADCYLQAQDIANAADTVDEALELISNTGENYFTAELLRIKGEVLRIENAVADAEASLQKAIDFAHKQGAQCWEQKAAESLAKLRLSHTENKE
jgi:predicted ATPase/class 3 adenylate cyclase